MVFQRRTCFDAMLFVDSSRSADVDHIIKKQSKAMLRLVYLLVLYQRCGGNVWALLTGKETSDLMSDSSTPGQDGEGESGDAAPNRDPAHSVNPGDPRISGQGAEDGSGASTRPPVPAASSVAPSSGGARDGGGAVFARNDENAPNIDYAHVHSLMPGDPPQSGHDVEEGSDGGTRPPAQAPSPVAPSSGGIGEGGDNGYAENYECPPKDPALVRTLIKGAIRVKITPLMMLTSVVADLDLFADWVFLNEGLEDQPKLLLDFALAFTVVGTVMYFLVTLEFHPIIKVWTWLRWGKPLSPGQHLSLGSQLFLNVILEDIPQLIITAIADPTSATGVFNMATAAFSLLAKAAEAAATLHDLPMASQARKIEADPGIVKYLRDRKLSLEREVEATAKLMTEYREEVTRCGLTKTSLVLAFEMMQTDGSFMNGALGYIRKRFDVQLVDLTECRLQGTIPPELGGLTALQQLFLNDNQLTGPIPPELGGLTALRKLWLDDNKLTGPIPPELGGLTALQTLSLHDNQLTGPIPPELGGLTALQTLSLYGNQLTGTIPTEVGGLKALQALYLYGNELTGPIPPELGRLTALQTLSLHDNQLTGPIPGELGQLKALTGVSFARNNFSGTDEDDLRRLLPAQRSPPRRVVMLPAQRSPPRRVVMG